MILQGKADEWCCTKPDRRDRCAFCRGPLRYPVLEWSPSFRGIGDDDYRSVFVCSECCNDIHGGFIRDLQKMKALRETRKLGFDRADPSGSCGVFIPPNTEH